MNIHVNIRKRLRAGVHRFELVVNFSSTDELVVIFGPSGSGKTLTLAAVAGLITPDNGRIQVGDRVLYDSQKDVNLPPQARRIGYLFQDYALFPHLSVAENIAFGLKRNWYHPLAADSAQRVEQLLSDFELQEVKHSLPSRISGGQRQRTALARALAGKPEALLLDEPFSALDRMLRSRMRRELLQLRSRFQVPMIMITHDPEDVAIFGDHVVVLEGGQVSDMLDLGRLLARADSPDSRLDLVMQALDRYTG
jgi:molybdate transport system ATP-binding protein